MHLCGVTAEDGPTQPKISKNHSRRQPITCCFKVLLLPLPKPVQMWSWRRDLNPRPSDYKSDALPAELRQPFPPEPAPDNEKLHRSRARAHFRSERSTAQKSRLAQTVWGSTNGGGRRGEGVGNRGPREREDWEPRRGLGNEGTWERGRNGECEGPGERQPFFVPLVPWSLSPLPAPYSLFPVFWGFGVCVEIELNWADL